MGQSPVGFKREGWVWGESIHRTNFCYCRLLQHTDSRLFGVQCGGVTRALGVCFGRSGGGQGVGGFGEALLTHCPLTSLHSRQSMHSARLYSTFTITLHLLSPPPLMPIPPPHIYAPYTDYKPLKMPITDNFPPPLPPNKQIRRNYTHDIFPALSSYRLHMQVQSVAKLRLSTLWSKRA